MDGCALSKLIEKIVSGGQTGVDRAALDVAAELGIARGGWCPRGRRAEDGPIPETYPLQETPSKDYAQRTEWNVRDSDGTLILAAGGLSGGTGLTKTRADDMGRPCMVVDLDRPADKRAVAEWARTHRISVLNIAGPRASQRPEIANEAKLFLRALLALL